MRVGIPTEIKDDEYRVAITPSGVRELTEHGHEVLIEVGAGDGSAIPDASTRPGRQIVPDADEVFGEAEMVVKVKEPQPVEIERLRPGQILFTYLHLAPDPELTGPAPIGRDRHRLRDGRADHGRTAAARADERDRRHDRDPGGRLHAREAARRARHPARRRARRRGRRT